MPHFGLACHLHEKLRPMYELRRGMRQSPVSVGRETIIVDAVTRDCCQTEGRPEISAVIFIRTRGMQAGRIPRAARTIPV